MADPICPTCRTPHPPLESCQAGQTAALRELFYRTATIDRCRLCQATVNVVDTLSGLPAKIDDNARVHDCEQLVDDTYEQLAGRTKALLLKMGKLDLCGGCKAEIFWIRHKTGQGAIAPYTAAAVNHFKDCPERGKFHAPRAFQPRRMHR